MQRNSFVFYKDWMEAIRDLPDGIRLEIYESVIRYATTGEFRGLKSLAGVAFNFIKTDIDRDIEKYVSVVERNKSNGAKGGRPLGDKNPEEPKKTSGLSGLLGKPKKPDNDNGNDNDDDNVKDKGKRLKKENIYAPEVAESFLKFQKWISENASRVNNLKEPFTIEQFVAIKKKYSHELILEVLTSMHNWADLTKKNISANLTFRTWANKRK